MIKGGGSDDSEDDFWGEGGAGAELFGDDPGDGTTDKIDLLCSLMSEFIPPDHLFWL